MSLFADGIISLKTRNNSNVYQQQSGETNWLFKQNNTTEQNKRNLLIHVAMGMNFNSLYWANKIRYENEQANLISGARHHNSGYLCIGYQDWWGRDTKERTKVTKMYNISWFGKQKWVQYMYLHINTGMTKELESVFKAGNSKVLMFLYIRSDYNWQKSRTQ